MSNPNPYPDPDINPKIFRTSNSLLTVCQEVRTRQNVVAFPECLTQTGLHKETSTSIHTHTQSKNFYQSLGKLVLTSHPSRFHNYVTQTNTVNDIIINNISFSLSLVYIHTRENAQQKPQTHTHTHSGPTLVSYKVHSHLCAWLRLRLRLVISDTIIEPSQAFSTEPQVQLDCS